MKDHPLYKAIVELSDCDDRENIAEARRAIVRFLSKSRLPEDYRDDPKNSNNLRKLLKFTVNPRSRVKNR